MDAMICFTSPWTTARLISHSMMYVLCISCWRARGARLHYKDTIPTCCHCATRFQFENHLPGWLTLCAMLWCCALTTSFYVATRFFHSNFAAHITFVRKTGRINFCTCELEGKRNALMGSLAFSMYMHFYNHWKFHSSHCGGENEGKSLMVNGLRAV